MASTGAPGSDAAGRPGGSVALPPSMTPSIPGVDGMTEEEIAAFLESLDECTPTIPDGLTNHYLKQSGIKEPDVRITRLISLAAQKFVTQIAQDARQCAQQDWDQDVGPQRTSMKEAEFTSPSPMHTHELKENLRLSQRAAAGDGKALTGAPTGAF